MEPRSHARLDREWLATYAAPIVAIAVIVLIAACFRFYYVPTESMDPTIEPGTRVAALIVPYAWTHDYRRGDIAVFDTPQGLGGVEGVDVLVKRVIAIGGDTVAVSAGELLVNGKRSPWQGATPNTGDFTAVVPDGEYFMMGDNRMFSMDSRYFGSVAAASMRGKVVFSYTPRFRIL